MQDAVGEYLSGFRRVLLVERADFLAAEVTQAQRFGFDVEGGAAGDDFLVGAVHAVVAYVAHAAGTMVCGNARGRWV